MPSKIIFSSEIDESKSQIGGGAWLPSKSDWPMCPKSGQPLLPLLTIKPDFFPTERFSSHDMALSVFISVKYNGDHFVDSAARHFSFSDQEQFKEFKPGYTRVLLHALGRQELYIENCFPLIKKHTIHLIDFTEEELDEELEDEDNGAEISKFLGRPFWLQDWINPGPKFDFEMQITEADIQKISPAHEGIFHDGIGYIFISKNLQRFKTLSEAGVFITQST